MVRRIIWTSRAEKIFSEILIYYFKRNGTKTYSRKLNNDIKQLTKILQKQPYLGRTTNIKNVRVIIKGYFKLFYLLEPNEIIILLVWDTRQDPNNLNIY
jgi:plasmid stabilization system protein ParE